MTECLKSNLTNKLMKVIVRVLGEAEASWGGRAQPGSQGPSHHTIQTTGQARG